MENCLAKSVLTGIKDNLSFKSIETYPIIQGIIGTNNNTIKESFIDVINIKNKPPINSKIFLKASDTDDETTDSISVVSVVILDKISPVNKRS